MWHNCIAPPKSGKFSLAQLEDSRFLSNSQNVICRSLSYRPGYLRLL